MIDPKCIRCNDELIKYGSLLIGPPDEQDKALKDHLCVKCYKAVKKYIALGGVRLSLLDKIKESVFGRGSAQERIVEIKGLINNEA